MSIPISSSTAIAWGRTDVGAEPADEILTPGGASARAMPSASWLRAEFATHRKRMCFGPRARRSEASVNHDGESSEMTASPI